MCPQAPRSECTTENLFSYFSTKTYVVGTQKNRLNETVLLSTQKHMFKLMDKKTITFLCSKIFLNWPYVPSLINPHCMHEETMSSCPHQLFAPGKFFMLFCRLLIFFKINFFEKFFQEYHLSVKHFVGPDLGQICLQRI